VKPPSGRAWVSARGDARPLREVIAARRAVREFGRRPLSDEEVSALLRSGQGITSALGGRAAPSAGAPCPVPLRVADHRGVFRYLSPRDAIEEVAAEDRRPHLAAAALGPGHLALGLVAVGPGRPAQGAEVGRARERRNPLPPGQEARPSLAQGRTG
jgi:hypothetical protein